LLASDGTAFSSSDLSHLQVQVSSNLVGWVTIRGALTPRDGVLQSQDKGSNNAPLGRHRIVELR
jgi:hypothetical protein